MPETINITTTNVATWTAASNLGGFVVNDQIEYNWEDISQTGTAVSYTHLTLPTSDLV